MRAMNVHDVRDAVVGGLCIGGAAGGLLLLIGKVAGISGILSRWLTRDRMGSTWRGWFIAGLIAGGALVAAVSPTAIGQSRVSLPLLSVAGLLVGFGARMGNGCTSGHGVCGIARASKRSLVATLTFMSTGVVSVLVMRKLGVWP